MASSFVRCIIRQVTNHLETSHLDTAEKEQEYQRQDYRHFDGNSAQRRSYPFLCFHHGVRFHQNKGVLTGGLVSGFVSITY